MSKALATQKPKDNPKKVCKYGVEITWLDPPFKDVQVIRAEGDPIKIDEFREKFIETFNEEYEIKIGHPICISHKKTSIIAIRWID